MIGFNAADRPLAALRLRRVLRKAKDRAAVGDGQGRRSRSSMLISLMHFDLTASSSPGRRQLKWGSNRELEDASAWRRFAASRKGRDA
jgi:hypothetical protein